MTQHIPYHDMYSGPGESMGEKKAYDWSPKIDEDKIVAVMKRDYGPFESGWDMGSRPLVWSDPFFITDTTIEYNTEDHEPLVWDREKTYKWVEII